MATFAFIDASNLFYGGEKSLGWKVDYRKLAAYLKAKYGVSRILYSGGVEIDTFHYDYLQNDTVPLDELEKHLDRSKQRAVQKSDSAQALLLDKYLKRLRFYLKLKQFGYELYLKPVKHRKEESGVVLSKANCDVEISLYLITQKELFDRALVLSGDGDFLPVLKYLRTIGKEITVVARSLRTAREIKKFAGDSFRDFTSLEHFIKYLSVP